MSSASDDFFRTASPSAANGERGSEGEEEQSTAVPTPSPALVWGQTSSPSVFRDLSSSDGDREEGRVPASTTAPTAFETPRHVETPAPSVSFLTLRPTGTSFSSEGQEERSSVDSDDDDGIIYPDGTETFAPSGAPTPATGSDGGVDGGDDVTPTPAPSSEGETLWAWWYQSGGEGADRGNALANGVGENVHHRYLVGTADGAVVDDDDSDTASSESTLVHVEGPG